jgi:hypothetical protein
MKFTFLYYRKFILKWQEFSIKILVNVHKGIHKKTGRAVHILVSWLNPRCCYKTLNFNPGLLLASSISEPFCKSLQKQSMTIIYMTVW